MKTKIVTLLTIIAISNSIIPVLTRAQSFSFLGARSFGMAHASSTNSDQYSVFNNPGTLGYVKSESISAGYLNLFGIESLGSVFATFSKSIRNGYASIGVLSFGDEVFRKNNLTFGFGNKLGIAGLGASINYHHYVIEGFGSHGFASLNVGGLAEISPRVLISGIIKNITQTRISTFTGEYLPTLMSVGISFMASDQLILNSQFDKNLDTSGLLKIGIEYTYSSLVLRTGLVSNPTLLSFGVGFHHNKLKIDYGIMNHQVLNSSHIFNLTYLFQNE